MQDRTDPLRQWHSSMLPPDVARIGSREGALRDLLQWLHVRNLESSGLTRRAYRCYPRAPCNRVCRVRPLGRRQTSARPAEGSRWLFRTRPHAPTVLEEIRNPLDCGPSRISKTYGDNARATEAWLCGRERVREHCMSLASGRGSEFHTGHSLFHEGCRNRGRRSSRVDRRTLTLRPGPGRP